MSELPPSKKDSSKKLVLRLEVNHRLPSLNRLFDEPLPKDEGEKVYSGRMFVSIESIRSKLLDTDNLYGGAKFFIDFLRYCGAIREDTEEQIDLRVTQRKTQKGEKEKTVIEVWKREE